MLQNEERRKRAGAEARQRLTMTMGGRAARREKERREQKERERQVAESIAKAAAAEGGNAGSRTNIDNPLRGATNRHELSELQRKGAPDPYDRGLPTNASQTFRKGVATDAHGNIIGNPKDMSAKSAAKAGKITIGKAKGPSVGIAVAAAAGTGSATAELLERNGFEGGNASAEKFPGLANTSPMSPPVLHLKRVLAKEAAMPKLLGSVIIGLGFSLNLEQDGFTQDGNPNFWPAFRRLVTATVVPRGELPFPQCVCSADVNGERIRHPRFIAAVTKGLRKQLEDGVGAGLDPDLLSGSVRARDAIQCQLLVVALAEWLVAVDLLRTANASWLRAAGFWCANSNHHVETDRLQQQATRIQSLLLQPRKLKMEFAKEFPFSAHTFAYVWQQGHMSKRRRAVHDELRSALYGPEEVVDENGGKIIRNHDDKVVPKEWEAMYDMKTSKQLLNLRNQHVFGQPRLAHLSNVDRSTRRQAELYNHYHEDPGSLAHRRFIDALRRYLETEPPMQFGKAKTHRAATAESSSRPSSVISSHLSTSGAPPLPPKANITSFAYRSPGKSLGQPVSLGGETEHKILIDAMRKKEARVKSSRAGDDRVLALLQDKDEQAILRFYESNPDMIRKQVELERQKQRKKQAQAHLEKEQREAEERDQALMKKALSAFNFKGKGRDRRARFHNEEQHAETEDGTEIIIKTNKISARYRGDLQWRPACAMQANDDGTFWVVFDPMALADARISGSIAQQAELDGEQEWVDRSCHPDSIRPPNVHGSTDVPLIGRRMFHLYAVADLTATQTDSLGRMMDDVDKQRYMRRDKFHTTSFESIYSTDSRGDRSSNSSKYSSNPPSRYSSSTTLNNTSRTSLNHDASHTSLNTTHELREETRELAGMLGQTTHDEESDVEEEKDDERTGSGGRETRIQEWRPPADLFIDDDRSDGHGYTDDFKDEYYYDDVNDFGLPAHLTLSGVQPSTHAVGRLAHETALAMYGEISPAEAVMQLKQRNNTFGRKTVVDGALLYAASGEDISVGICVSFVILWL